VDPHGAVVASTTGGWSWGRTRVILHHSEGAVGTEKLAVHHTLATVGRWVAGGGGWNRRHLVEVIGHQVRHRAVTAGDGPALQSAAVVVEEGGRGDLEFDHGHPLEGVRAAVASSLTCPRSLLQSGSTRRARSGSSQATASLAQTVTFLTLGPREGCHVLSLALGPRERCLCVRVPPLINTLLGHITLCPP
jgi:hypothetical protein